MVSVPHSGVKMGTGKLNAGDNPVMDKHPIQGGSRNAASHFMLLKLE